MFSEYSGEQERMNYVALFIVFIPKSGNVLSSALDHWVPFLESPGNLPGSISVFGDKCFRSQFLLASNTKF